MHSIANFINNILIFSVAVLVNIWSQSWFVWYAPDFFFIAVVWLQFVNWRLNYLALVFVSCFADVYFGGFFGSHLIAFSLVLYIMGVLNFASITTLRFASSLVVGLSWIGMSQLLLFINFGVVGVLNQLWLYTVLKACITLLTWLCILSILYRQTLAKSRV